MGPKMPKELSAPPQDVYSAKQFNDDVAAYRVAVAKPDLAGALTLRNQIAYHVMADIETSYGRFEMKLSSQRAVQGTLADATTLGLTAATSVVGASDVKDILAATGTAFQGAWTSYDKNFFQQKSTEALISQMRATRKTKQAQLITSLATRDVTSYPWDAVWIDLVDFYYAGTVPSAMVEIASNAGTQADKATATLNNAVAALTPRTPSQAQEAIEVRKAYDKLSAEATGTDATQAAAAMKAIGQILTAAGYSPSAGASAQDLLALFRTAIGDARVDNNKLASLSAAVAAANVQ